MTQEDLQRYNQVQKRIDQLEEEIYALHDAMGKRINLMKKIIRTFSCTKKKDYGHDCEIELTLEDMRLLQDVRLRELKGLRMIIKENRD